MYHRCSFFPSCLNLNLIRDSVFDHQRCSGSDDQLGRVDMGLVMVSKHPNPSSPQPLCVDAVCDLLPCTSYPSFFRMRAIAEIPWPLTPTKWMTPVEGGNPGICPGISFKRASLSCGNRILIDMGLSIGEWHKMKAAWLTSATPQPFLVLLERSSSSGLCMAVLLRRFFSVRLVRYAARLSNDIHFWYELDPKSMMYILNNRLHELQYLSTSRVAKIDEYKSMV